MRPTVESAFDAYTPVVAPDREPDFKFHPSSLYTCRRQAVYQVRGTEPSDVRSAASRRPLAVGKVLHELVQAALTHGGSEVYHEVAVDMPDLNITGSADTLRIFDDGMSEVVEIKSKSTRGIAFMLGKHGSGLPEDAHVNQGLTYAFGLKHYPFKAPGGLDYGDEDDRRSFKPLGEPMVGTRVVYVGKDDHSFREYARDLTPRWEDEFLAFALKMNRYRDDHEALPPRVIEDRTKFPCSYCPFVTRCYRDREGVEL